MAPAESALAAPLAAPAGTAPAERDTGGTLTIDLAAIEANWRTLAHQALTVECAAVVKANAYGLGLEPVATRLAQAGCKTFFVADLAEARRVRKCAGDATIYVLNGCTPEDSPGFVALDARPVINSMTELAEWDAFVAANDWRGGAALQVNTGMNRLGISPEEAVALAPRTQTENHGITLLMSHLACAEVPDHPLTASQLKLFRDIRALYGGIPASLASSSGIYLGDAALYDLARPGAALYGVNPTPGRDNPMRGVVELSGRILQVRNIAEGETVGYGATWTAKRPSRIVIVALGYADGLLRAASGSDAGPGGVAIVAEMPCPIVGRISMDLACIDVTDVANGAVHRGDVATFIGARNGIDDFAAAAGTIGYEILTRLGLRCRVVYRGLDGSQ
jgi:alanine racemase